MRFYTTQPKVSCGIALHARSMDVCLLSQEGELLVQQNLKAGPETFLQGIAPSRADSVVAVECLCPWSWLADLGARKGRPCVLGKKMAYKANRDGVAHRCPDPAVPKSLEVDLALIDQYDRLLNDLESAIVNTAKPHDAHTLYLLQTVPGGENPPPCAVRREA